MNIIQEIPKNELDVFRNKVKQWLELDIEISNLEKKARELKKIRNKQLEPDITKFMTQFNITDLRAIFNLFGEMNMPISINNCLTISEIINVKNSEQFLNSFFKNFKTNNSDYKIIHNGETYNICINENDFKIIESEIIKYIELITESDFNEFIYAK